MKKTLFFVVAIALMAFRSSATIHQITASDNFTFTPSSLSFPLGDTVQWVLASGTTMAHTTTSNTTAPGIPAGAAPWDHNFSTQGSTFMYVPTVTGTYNYHCTFHQSLGMIGSFTVTPPAGVVPVGVSNVSVYPNPASSTVRLQFADAATTSVQVTNILGSTVLSTELHTNDASLNVNDLPNGTYIINVTHGDIVYKHELLIAH